MVEKIIRTRLNLGNGHYEIMAISEVEMAISMVTEQALRVNKNSVHILIIVADCIFVTLFKSSINSINRMMYLRMSILFCLYLQILNIEVIV